MTLFIFSEILSDSDGGDVDDGEGEENHEVVVGDEVEALEDQVFHRASILPNFNKKSSGECRMTIIYQVDMKVRCATGRTVLVEIHNVSILHFATSINPVKQLAGLAEIINRPSHNALAALGTAPATHKLVGSNNGPNVSILLKIVTVVNDGHMSRLVYFNKKSST